MLRCLLVFILFFGFHQFIMGQNCRTITNGSLVFTDKWNESINFVNSSVAPFSISYEGNTNTSLSIGNDFKFSQAQVINIPANGSTPASTQNIAAQGYFINTTCSLPAVEGDIKVIHTLKRNFVKGFYTLDFFTSGANIQAFCLYGSGTVAAIPFTTALNTYTSTTSVSGLTNSFSINNSQNSAKRIVYLEGEMNFFVYGTGRMTGFTTPQGSSTSLQAYNSFKFSITPLSSPEQICEQYVANVDEGKSTCGLGTINMEVLDKESNYLFFYRKTTTSPYQIHPNVLVPNKDRKITISYIPYVNDNIPIWGIIRTVDGCTFYQDTNPIQFKDTRFQINTPVVVPITNCGSQTRSLTIPLTTVSTQGVLKNGLYEVTLLGNSTPSFLKTTIELASSSAITTRELLVPNIPLDFVVTKINVIHTETNCSATLDYSLPIATPTLPVLNIPPPVIACTATLTLEGINNFPCGKIVWYKRDATDTEYKQIATTKSIEVSPIIPTTYKAKFFVNQAEFEITKDILPIVNPIIYDLAFNSNPHYTNSGNLTITPLTNVDLSTCSCNTTIIDNATGLTTTTLASCSSSIPMPFVGNYTVNFQLFYGNCLVKTSKIVQVIDPFNVVLQTTTANIAPLNTYTTTKTLLDEAYFIQKNGQDKLNFQYYQQYEPFDLGKVYAKLYNWQRTVVAYTEIDRQYGIQWYDMPIPNNIVTTNGSYILELSDDNGWIQKFRVKGITNNPTCGILRPEGNTYCLSSNNGFKLYDLAGGQTPYQVKWTLSYTNNIVLEEKIISTQSTYCTYTPTASLLTNNTTYKLLVEVKDACGTVFCTKDKTFVVESGNCTSTPNPIKVETEIPKVDIRINVLPQNPTTPVIKN